MSNKTGFFRTNRFLIGSIILLVVTLLIDEAIFSDQKRRVDPKKEITENLSEQLAILDKHIDEVSDIAIVDLNRLFNRFTPNEELPYFLYEEGNVIYWSTNRFVPKYGTLDGTYIHRYLKFKHGEYVVRRKVINSAQNRIVEIYALLPLASDVPLNNSFLEYGLNGEIFGRSSFVLTDLPEEPERNIYSPQGTFLFSFEGTERMKIDYPSFSVFIFLLYLVSIAAFIWSGFSYAIKLVGQDKPYLAVGLITVFLAIVRLTMLRYEYPLSIIEWSLFQPDNFAQSWWQPSLGDFILNQVAILVAVGFGYSVFSKRQRHFTQLKPRAVLPSFLLLLVALYYFVTQVESLLINSQWSFDIAEDISFAPFKLLAYFALFVIAIMPFLIGQYTCKALTKVNKGRRINLVLSLLGISGVVLGVFLLEPKGIVAALLMAYLLIVFNFRLSDQLDKVNYNTFLYFFTAAFLMASVCTSVLTRHIISENMEDKRSLATELMTENDLIAEFLLSEAKDNIQGDVLIQTNISSPFASKEQIRRLIQRVYLGDAFDKYEIEILLFNGRGRPINSNTVVSYQDLLATYAVAENTTDFEGLYFYRRSYPIQLNQYYLFIEIQRYNTTVGYILIKLDRQEQLNNSILPRLLLEESFETENVKQFDYAVYNINILSASNGDFNYSRNFNINLLSDPELFDKGLRIDGYHHLGIKGSGSEQVYVVSNPLYPPKYLITNFALFFLFMVAAIIMIFGVSAIFYNVRKTSTTLSAKIQILLNFAFFLPLIIVSIVVLRLVNRTVEEKIETQYLSVTESAAQNLANQLQLFLEGQNENNEPLENQISEISQYAQADINLFNTNGRLIATNQRLIFENELLASFANPNAMANIVEAGNKEQLSEERVGELLYKATFYGIRSNEDNRLLGVLSMPFFDSEEQLKAEQRDILSNILNAFTFIFVIFVVLSFLASKILTYPFNYLTQKIKSTTLSTLNEPLEWQADDEIGLVVREYNKMLLNLEKSKKALALSEKESAWREMAQQVAHEIKNPLTPMKLKLQHLRRVLETAPGQDTDFKKPIESLLNQVETLSDIATSFSSFAKMPIPISERLDLAEELRKSVRLFKGNTLEITTNIPKLPVWVMGDTKLLGRIFNNLILNAEQAIADGEGALKVELLVTYNKARVIFEDNGSGIPSDIKEKIFIPKFSTKEKGSGIGLAIAKRGVEHAGGSIWFDSTLGEGTTFYLEFPLTD